MLLNNPVHLQMPQQASSQDICLEKAPSQCKVQGSNKILSSQLQSDLYKIDAHNKTQVKSTSKLTLVNLVLLNSEQHYVHSPHHSSSVFFYRYI